MAQELMRAASGSKRGRDAVAAERKGGSSSLLTNKKARRVKQRDAFLEGVDALKQRLYDPSAHPYLLLAPGSDDGKVPPQKALDFSGLEMTPAAHTKPFWVTPTGSIYLEGMIP